VVKDLLNAYNPDTIESEKLKVKSEKPGASPDEVEKEFKKRHAKLVDAAASVFTGDLNEYIENVRKIHSQIIDTVNPDTMLSAGWNTDNTAKAQTIIQDFTAWIESHKDEITALQIFYGQPYRRRELTFKMIKDVFDTLKTQKPALAPLNVWRAYETLGQSNGSPKNELIALVSLIRRVTGIDKTLTAYDKTVDKNFQDWVFKKQAGTLKFTDEQMQWLRMIKDFVANSFHVEKGDFDLDPFNKIGGLGKMWQLFGERTDEIINELNETLAA